MADNEPDEDKQAQAARMQQLAAQANVPAGIVLTNGGPEQSTLRDYSQEQYDSARAAHGGTPGYLLGATLQMKGIKPEGAALDAGRHDQNNVSPPPKNQPPLPPENGVQPARR